MQIESGAIDWSGIGHDEMAEAFMRLALDAPTEADRARYRTFAQLHLLHHVVNKPMDKTGGVR